MTVWIVEENAEKHWLFMGAFSSVANANAYTAKRAEEQEDGDPDLRFQITEWKVD